MTQKRYLELVEELLEHEYRYHTLDDPTISDYQYDMLKKELEDIEEKHPEWVVDYSPSKRVGSSTKREFKEVNHLNPLLSLENSYNKEDLFKFLDKIHSEYGASFIMQYKIDGLSVSLRYKDGVFVEGSTRGNGYQGEDITENLKTINTIPLKLSQKVDITVRGEVFMPIASFKLLNESMQEKGKKIFANPRNAAAGSLRQLDSSITAQRNLDIYVFQILSENRLKTQLEEVNYLKELGFKVADTFYREDYHDFSEILDDIFNKRSKMTFEIDGAVIKVNEVEFESKIGYTSKSPKFQIAYKFMPNSEITKLIDVIWQVGRTGRVTPTAIMEPVFVGGSTISRATLHNIDYIRQRDLRIGDRVVIEKAGDVIPKVVKSIAQSRDGTEKTILEPELCPDCGSKLFKYENMVDLHCLNINCPSIIKRKIIHFVSKHAFDIDDLGEKRIERFYQEGFIKNISDIFRIEDKKDELLNLEKFAQKSVDNLIKNINSSKKIKLDRFIYSLGIDNIGRQAAKVLANKFKDIESLMDATTEQIVEIDEFGLIMAQSVVDFFKLEENRKMISELFKLGVQVESIQSIDRHGILYGKTFGITGSFQNYKRDQLREIIEENGGIFRSDISKNTQYLLAGEKAGSKLKKAQSLGVEIIDIEQFLKILGE